MSGRRRPAAGPDPEVIGPLIARRVREAVAGMLGTPEARRRAGISAGGDPTYAIDEVAERAVGDVLSGLEDVALFTEDRGLVVRGRPAHLFLVDPVDGTRPAMAGHGSGCVSIAVAPYGEDVTMGDVTHAWVVELATGASFAARRGGGRRGVTVRGGRIAPSGTRSLRGLIWAAGFRGQPAVLLAAALADLFDVPGSEGAFFDHGSAAYSLTRIATGQLDAYVDPGQRLVEEVPGAEAAFRPVGGGEILNTTTYDLAAGYLLLRELGCLVTDATGRPLEGIPLIGGDGRASLVSMVAASGPDLHAEILRAVDGGIERARRLAAAASEVVLGEAGGGPRTGLTRRAPRRVAPRRVTPPGGPMDPRGSAQA